MKGCAMNDGNSNISESKAGSNPSNAFSSGAHKRVQVIITSEASSSSVSAVAGSSDENSSGVSRRNEGSQRKARFEVRHLDEDELRIDTSEKNHRSDMISSFQDTSQVAATTPVARVHPPLSQQTRHSPGASTSPNSLSSLQGYEATSTLLTTTTTNFTPNHLLRGDLSPSRNPSIKSTGYTDGGGASARIRSLRRRISHTLLFLPEQRRVSTASAVR